MNWWEDPVLVLDFETTGTDPKTARIVQAALLLVDCSGKVDGSVCGLVDCPGEIPPEASAIHGITTEKATNFGFAPYMMLACLQRTMNAFKHLPLVIFNVPYDWPLFVASYHRTFHWNPNLSPKFLDPLCIDRGVDRYRKGGRKLHQMAAHYGITLAVAHEAGSDALCSVLILRAIVRAFPALKNHTLDELQTLQATWHNTWRDGMNDYWARSGKQERITGSWPWGDCGDLLTGATDGNNQANFEGAAHP